MHEHIEHLCIAMSSNFPTQPQPSLNFTHLTFVAPMIFFKSLSILLVFGVCMAVLHCGQSFDLANHELIHAWQNK